jgi:N6-L-threonylcarbamoyladenine synthase
MYKTVLAIETSCDETAAAVLVDGKLRSNVVYSQIDLHTKYGGVVPSIARLAHQQKLPDVIQQALTEAGIAESDIQAVAVTVGPGLAIALEIGLDHAKTLAQKLSIPFIPVNHMEGHLWSWVGDQLPNIAANEQIQTVSFPALGVLVSGKHSEWIQVNGVGEYQKLGQTLDDACGEAFDKVATMLKLGYPGGPAVSKLAGQVRDSYAIFEYRDNASTYISSELNGTKYRLPIPLAHTGDLNVSFSGLKTAVKQLIAEMSGAEAKLNIQETGAAAVLSAEQMSFVCLLFETAAVGMMERKIRAALKHSAAGELWLGGGVVANEYFRQRMQQVAQDFGLVLRFPESKLLTGDNAAMIGVVASLRPELATNDLSSQDRQPNLSL